MGKTGRNVSIVGLGTWQLGAVWGTVDQARSNAEAAGASGIDSTFDVGVREIYDRYFRASIHPRW